MPTGLGHGRWSPARIAAYLEEMRIPLRLAAVSESGRPVVVSLWYQPSHGSLWCASQRRSRIVRILDRDSRCGFEVAADQPPYRGVRGQGRARLVPERGAEILDRLLQRYGVSLSSELGRWLRSRAAQEIAIEIRPDRISTWDYSQRMTPQAVSG
jgi:nitroimidazol reductase NimA-like FMN-containing flavoprotein (pyridoxamine 5'-phosphate oxidase superfamily)